MLRSEGIPDSRHQRNPSPGDPPSVTTAPYPSGAARPVPCDPTHSGLRPAGEGPGRASRPRRSLRPGRIRRQSHPESTAIIKMRSRPGEFETHTSSTYFEILDDFRTRRVPGAARTSFGYGPSATSSPTARPWSMCPRLRPSNPSIGAFRPCSSRLRLQRRALNEVFADPVPPAIWPSRRRKSDSLTRNG